MITSDYSYLKDPIIDFITGDINFTNWNEKYAGNERYKSIAFSKSSYYHKWINRPRRINNYWVAPNSIELKSRTSIKLKT